MRGNSRARIVFLGCLSILTAFPAGYVFGSETLTGDMANTSDSSRPIIDSNTMVDVTGTDVTLTGSDSTDVLCVSTFSMDLAGYFGTTRYPEFQIQFNNSDIIAGPIQRKLDGIADEGIGSLVGIADNVDLDPGKEFILQARSVTGSSWNRRFGVRAQLSCVDLETSSTDTILNNDTAYVGAAGVTTSSTSFSEVTGTELTVNLPSYGGFYVAASTSCKYGGSGTGSTNGEWRLEYKAPGAGSYSAIGYTMVRTISNTSDLGIVNLVARVAPTTTIGDYNFRLAHRTTNSPDTVSIKTSYTNIVAVALGFVSGDHVDYFEIDSAYASSDSTTNNFDNWDTCLTDSIVPGANMNLFAHAQYNVTASAALNPAYYRMNLNSATAYLERYLSSASDVGSAATAAYYSGLVADTTYHLTLQFAREDGSSATLTTNDPYMVWIELTSQQYTSTSVETFEACFDAETGNAELQWTTDAEIDLAGYNLYRGENPDGDRTRLNDELILARGDMYSGAEYTFTDETAEFGKAYFYWLEASTRTGQVALHGPIDNTTPCNTPSYVHPPASVAAGVSERATGALNALVLLLCPAAVLLFWKRFRRSSH